jgi:hypothetical protein
MNDECVDWADMAALAQMMSEGLCWPEHVLGGVGERWGPLVGECSRRAARLREARKRQTLVKEVES